MGIAKALAIASMWASVAIVAIFADPLAGVVIGLFAMIASGSMSESDRP